MSIPDLPEFTPEFHLLLASALHPLKGDEIKGLQARCRAEVDWSHFSDLVRRHRVGPTVYRNLSQYTAAAVPGPILAGLKKRDERNRKQVFQLLATLSQLSTWFALENIKLCVLKGPLLAQHLYEDVGLRTSSDLDLLIPLKSLAQADALLLAIGCQRIFPSQKLTPRQWKAYRREWYNFTYYYPQRQVYIELHWAIGPPYLVQPQVTHQMLTHANPMSLSDRVLFILADEDLPVYLLIHGSKHNWERLKWLLDLVVWMRQARIQDWTTLIRLNDVGLSRSLAQGLLLAHSLFSIPSPTQGKPPLTVEKPSQNLVMNSIKALLNPHYSGADVGHFRRVKHVLYTMKLKRGLRYKWVAFTKLWIMPKDWQDFPLPDFLFSLYLPLRPFLWLWRYHLSPRRKHP